MVTDNRATPQCQPALYLLRNTKSLTNTSMRHLEPFSLGSLPFLCVPETASPASIVLVPTPRPKALDQTGAVGVVLHATCCIIFLCFYCIEVGREGNREGKEEQK